MDGFLSVFNALKALLSIAVCSLFSELIGVEKLSAVRSVICPALLRVNVAVQLALMDFISQSWRVEVPLTTRSMVLELYVTWLFPGRLMPSVRRRRADKILYIVVCFKVIFCFDYVK